MTSIVCWYNRDDWFEGLWAVADSRVSTDFAVLTDNCPKLSVMRALSFEDDDQFRQHPKLVLTFGFGFAGSTLIGNNVREMLSALLGNLQPIHYYDADPSFETRIPSLAQIAELTQALAARYVRSLGVYHPNAARTEILIYGYCRNSGSYKSYRVFNPPTDPATIAIEEVAVSEHNFLILGDRREEVRELIVAQREHLEEGSLNWERAPVLVLATLLNAEVSSSIGGYLQLCATTPHEVRQLPLAPSEGIGLSLTGFDLFAEDMQYHLGGFRFGYSIALQFPTASGWENATRIASVTPLSANATREPE